jgi:surfeit locus 1 family protein
LSGSGRRFPWALTISALVAIVALAGLGVWQLQRLAWKETLLAKIAALATAPARPLPGVLTASGPADFMRVEAHCEPVRPVSPATYRYAVRDGRIGWRLLGVCRTAAGPYDGIVVDRGVVEMFMGATSPQAAAFPALAAVTGVLRAAGAAPMLGSALMEQGRGYAAYRLLDRASLTQIASGSGVGHPAPYLLAAEHEAPPLAGVTPAALPQDIPNNHLVYAMTWFALAGILAWFYAAMLLQRLRR